MGSTPDRTEIFTSSPKHPENLWGPPSFLFNVYQALLPERLKQPGLKMTTLSDIVLSLRITGATPSVPPYAFKAGKFSNTAAETTNLAGLNNIVKLPIINTISKPFEICVRNIQYHLLVLTYLKQGNIVIMWNSHIVHRMWYDTLHLHLLSKI